MAADSQAFERGQRVQGTRYGGPGALRRFMLAGMASISYPGSQAEQLLLAPQELRTADPSFATELYNGHFGLAGRLAELGWDRRLVGSLAALLVGDVAIYIVGLPWLSAAAHLSVEQTIAVGLTPFLVGDLAKIVVAAFLLPAGWWVVARRPSDR